MYRLRRTRQRTRLLRQGILASLETFERGSAISSLGKPALSVVLEPPPPAAPDCAYSLGSEECEKIVAWAFRNEYPQRRFRSEMPAVIRQLPDGHPNIKSVRGTLGLDQIPTRLVKEIAFSPLSGDYEDFAVDLTTLFL